MNKRILVIHGPNLNMLGKRDPAHYGTLTLAAINEFLKKEAQIHHVTLVCFQSNHEGAMIDFLQKEAHKSNAILINPGALTHYSYALADAVADTKLPAVEVHLSDIDHREAFRRLTVFTDIVLAVYKGEKEKSYQKGLAYIIAYLEKGEK